MLGACGMSVTFICQVPRKPNLNLSMTSRLRSKKTIAVTLAIVFVVLSVLGTLPAHAVTSPPPWTVSLIPNSTSFNALTSSPKNGGIQTATQTRAFRIGVVINATGTNPGPTCGVNCIPGVFGWQFGIVYDNTTVIPQGDPSGSYTGSPNPVGAGDPSDNIVVLGN